jgi:hypothetical protein
MLKNFDFFGGGLLFRLTSGIILDNGSGDENIFFATTPIMRLSVKILPRPAPPCQPLFAGLYLEAKKPGF